MTVFPSGIDQVENRKQGEKHMITIKSIRNVKYDEYDEVWAIVRSMKNKSDKIKQVQALSPSLDLFFKYQRLAKAGEWNEQTFRDIYVPQFLHEIKNDEAYAYLNQLFFADKAGKNICVVCFCPNETMCHRSIIAGLLQGVGCNVQTETGNDYTKYYKMFQGEN